MKLRYALCWRHVLTALLVLVGCGACGNGASPAPMVPVHSVIYDANGGMGAPVDSATYPAGATVTVEDPGAIAYPGYVFVVWNTAADGSGMSYAGGATLAIGDADLTLYANWVLADRQPALPDGTRIAANPTWTDFMLTPVDPEGDTFTVAFKGCTSNHVDVELCVTAACDTTATLDCSIAYAPGNTPQLVDVAVPITGHVQAPDYTQTTLAISTLYFVFDDPASPLAPADTPVIVDARFVNTAPQLTVQGQNVAEYDAVIATTDSFTPIIQMVDPDFTGQTQYFATVDVTLDNTEAPATVFNVARLEELAAGYDSCQTGLIVTDTHLALTCGIDNINELLFAILLDGPGGTSTVNTVVTVNLSDNGYVGQCADVAEATLDPCPLSAQVTVKEEWDPVP